MINIKAHLDTSEIRRFSVDPKLSFPEFESTLDSVFGLADKECKFYYKDDEGDFICFSTNNEWEEAKKIVKDKAIIKIETVGKKTKTVVPQAQQPEVPKPAEVKVAEPVKPAPPVVEQKPQEVKPVTPAPIPTPTPAPVSIPAPVQAPTTTSEKPQELPIEFNLNIDLKKSTCELVEVNSDVTPAEKLKQWLNENYEGTPLNVEKRKVFYSMFAKISKPEDQQAVLEHLASLKKQKEKQPPVMEKSWTFVEVERDQPSTKGKEPATAPQTSEPSPAPQVPVPEPVQTPTPAPTPAPVQIPTMAVPQKPVHNNYACDSCGSHPIIGCRYSCQNCPNYDLCENCFPLRFRFHNEQHGFVAHATPIEERTATAPAAVQIPAQVQPPVPAPAPAPESKPILEASVDTFHAIKQSVVAPIPFENELRGLNAMGFTDNKLLTDLLTKYQGNVERVVDAVLGM